MAIPALEDFVSRIVSGDPEGFMVDASGQLETVGASLQTDAD